MISSITDVKTIYLAGPMSGYKNFNFPRFDAVAAALEAEGHTVFNPAERDRERHGKDISADNHDGCQLQAREEHGFSIRDALADDMEFICRRANCIILLPGWEQSNGAQAEHRTAVALRAGHEEMDIIYLTEEQCLMIEEEGLFKDAVA